MSVEHHTSLINLSVITVILYIFIIQGIGHWALGIGHWALGMERGQGSNLSPLSPPSSLSPGERNFVWDF